MWLVVAAPLPRIKVQSAPNSPPAGRRLYSQPVIAASFGSFQDSTTSPAPAAAVSPVGLAGTASGVAVASSDAAPFPLAFTARTLKV